VGHPTGRCRMSRLKLSLNELANANAVPNRAPSGSGPPYTGRKIIRRKHRPYDTTIEPPGLARLWNAKGCVGKRVPSYPTSYCQGINLDCPEDWYLVNIRTADYGAVSEIAKYVAKGDEIVSAGPVKVATYLIWPDIVSGCSRALVSCMT